MPFTRRVPMKRALPQAGLALAVSSALITMVWFHQNPAPPPTLEATCRQVADDPAKYAGREVLLKTDGCEDDGPGRLVWRRASSEGPAVVVLCAERKPVLAGLCHYSGVGPPVVDARR